MRGKKFELVNILIFKYNFEKLRSNLWIFDSLGALKSIALETLYLKLLFKFCHKSFHLKIKLEIEIVNRFEFNLCDLNWKVDRPEIVSYLTKVD